MLTDQLPPRGPSTGKQHLFRRTLPNVGNTCFFNSVLQVIASLPAFVTEIEQIPLPPDHADSSHCLAFLKLFTPAIVSPTSLPSNELDLSSVKTGGGWMTRADWIDFILRLTTKYDTRYVIGALADPGDLLEYFLFIVPGAGRMCAMDFKWSTRSSCVCQTAGKWTLSEERGIAISITSNAPLIHHIRSAFNPEEVYDYRCDLCQTHTYI